MMEECVLSLNHLNIEFHDHERPETVVRDLNLKVNRGEIAGIVGESGSGKTMTALAIAGLLQRKDMEKSGEILFDGKNLLSCSRSVLREIQGNKISMIFQEPMTSLNPVRKIGWQIEEGLRLHTTLDRAERKERATEWIKKVNLPERVYDQYPHELSGGMRQRVMIAAAMISQPDILIADEPTTALDVTIQAQVVELLKKINKQENTSILFISHDLSLVRQLCKKVFVMHDGVLVEQGDCEKIFAAPEHAYTKTLLAAIPRIERKA